ncbi:MAG: hypothetical protein ISS36_00105 [Candidatus Aenigmarchaeota archaeon]|nr:hypothetical protein [Candidatus Aenigmarchaeota archaeon]
MDITYMRIEQTLFPSSENYMPDFSKTSKACTYFPFLIMQKMVFTRKAAQIERDKDEEKGFCWEDCDIEECPTYQAERKE